jgi:uncharacterized protein YjiS (DUF1127 family)
VDEEEEEGALATCLRVMADVQQSFFQGGERAGAGGARLAPHALHRCWAWPCLVPGQLSRIQGCSRPTPLRSPLPHAGDPGTADVRPLLRSARQAILRGVQVLFSRVLPLDCADPTVHPLWQLATKVGARRAACHWLSRRRSAHPWPPTPPQHASTPTPAHAACSWERSACGRWGRA